MTKPTSTSRLNNPSHSDLHNFHINVKMFGAVGDGVTDDRVAIQAALDAAVAAGGGTVYVPPTSAFYNLTSPVPSDNMPCLQIKGNNIRLTGAGRASRLHASEATKSVVQVSNITAINQDTPSYSNITIDHLYFTQTLPHIDDSFPCVNFRSVINGRVLFCDFSDYSAGVSMNRRNNTTDVYPEHCVVAFNRFKSSANHNMAIEIIGAKWCAAYGNQIEGTVGIGIRDNVGWGGFESTIMGNVVRGVNVGIKLDGGDRSHVIGNRVIGVTGASATAIQVTNNADDNFITNNYLDDYVYGVWAKSDSVGGVRRLVVKNNRFRNSASTTAAVFADPVAAGTVSSEITVVDNHIDGLAGGNGVYFDGIDGQNVILRNTMRLAGSVDGIRHANSVAGSRTTALDNTLIGVNLGADGDITGTGSGKFVHWNHDGVDTNHYIDTNGDTVISSIYSPPQITANQNDYDPANAFMRQTHVTTWRISSDAARNITGIAGGRQGLRLLLVNTGGFAITLKNDDANSTAANRILGGGADVVIAATTGSAQLVYDDTTARWRKV